MTTPVLFQYPAEPLRRRHRPRGYETPAGYKPWLRDDFSFRCVYCLERETWYPDLAASFSVEHFVPVAVGPALALDYDNLGYACTRCNSSRRAEPTLNPATVPLGGHVLLGADGMLTGLTDAGNAMIDLFHLNENPALSVRRLFQRLLQLSLDNLDGERAPNLLSILFGYPADMPDLRTLRPPGGNANPGSEDDCYFARAERGELSPVY